MSPHDEEAISPSQHVAVDKATASDDGTLDVSPAEAPAGRSSDGTHSVAQPGTAAEGDLIDPHDGEQSDQTNHDSAKLHSSDDASGLAADAMSSSVATLRPVTLPTTTTASQYLTAESHPYVDPTPPTPKSSRPPSRAPSASNRSSDPSPARSDAVYDEKRYTSEDEQERGSRSEIQSIMEQFSEEGGGPGADEVMSPRLEIASPLLGSSIQHPPRKSSLEPLATGITHQFQEPPQGLGLSTASPVATTRPRRETNDHGPPVPPKDDSAVYGSARPRDDSRGSISVDSPMSSISSLHRPPPPEPEPEPTLAFDFHRFLEQLRNKKADPVARYLKSFLSEFAKRQWMVHEQVKIIGDFLAFIANKMAQCEVWRDVSDAEFDNAREGMEKLVMNRLYTQTFSPAIPAPQPIPGAKPKKKGGERPLGPGRRGQHQEDVERDEVLAQKIGIYGWVREEHLDIPPVSESGKRFLKLAQQELLKIKSYRAPRDKIICVLNCCKVIFGLLKHSKSDSSADSFMPMLIYVVLQANPEHLVSNVQYILRFRNQEKLGGEAGYYLSSLMGAIQFIENMDRTTLTITDEEFEHNVEAAVSAIAEKHRAELPPVPPTPPSEKPPPSSSTSTSLRPPQAGITAATAALAAVTGASPSSSSQRPSLDADRPSTPTPRRSTSSNEAHDGAGGGGGGDSDEKAAISGLLRTIQKPLSTIGRIFSDEAIAGSGAGSSNNGGIASPARTPVPERGGRQYHRGGARGGGRDEEGAGEGEGDGDGDGSGEGGEGQGELHTRQRLSAEEAAARQASAEAAEAQRLHRAEHANVVETLAGMFPDLDREIISDVVYQKEGRVGLAVDACLALSA